MRIITGALKGRKLLTPEDAAIRPTTDRTRESIFNLLMHGQFAGAHILDQRVADLCCGTGALGLEALSRGAAWVTGVDSSKQALALAETNAKNLGVLAKTEWLKADITALPTAREPYALVMLDPPYDQPLLAMAHASLRQRGWLMEGSLLLAEQSAFADVYAHPSLNLLVDRRYGKKTRICIWQVSALA